MPDIYKSTFARSFTAASSLYLERGTALLTAPPFTMACWFLTIGAGVIRSLMSHHTNGSGNNRFTMFGTGTEKLSVTTVNNAGTSASALSVASHRVNAWNSAVGIWASTASRTACLNGVVDTPETTSLTPNAPNRTSIGRHNSTSPNYMNGQIAWPAIWNVALTEDDVARFHAGVSPLLIRPENLVNFWDWTGADEEMGVKPDCSISNTGSLPINGPGFLVSRIMRRPSVRKVTAGGFKPYWATRRSRIIGGGVT